MKAHSRQIKVRTLLVAAAVVALGLGLRRWLYRVMVEPWWWDTHSAFLGSGHVPAAYVMEYPHLWYGVTVALSLALIWPTRSRALPAVAILVDGIALLSWFLLRRFVNFGPGFLHLWPDGFLSIFADAIDNTNRWYGGLPAPFLIHQTHNICELGDLGFLVASFFVLRGLQRGEVSRRTRHGVAAMGIVCSLLYWLARMRQPTGIAGGNMGMLGLDPLRFRGTWTDLAEVIILLAVLAAILVLPFLKRAETTSIR